MAKPTGKMSPNEKSDDYIKSNEDILRQYYEERIKVSGMREFKSLEEWEKKNLEGISFSVFNLNRRIKILFDGIFESEKFARYTKIALIISLSVLCIIRFIEIIFLFK